MWIHNFVDLLEPLREKLRCDPKTLTVVEVCKPRLLIEENFMDKAKYEPAITFFGLSDKMMQILKQFASLQDSRIFRQIWSGHYAEASRRTALPVAPYTAIIDGVFKLVTPEVES